MKQQPPFELEPHGSVAWGLMIMIAIRRNELVGYGANVAKIQSGLHFVLPLVVSIAFLITADIDTPWKDFGQLAPQNLISLSESKPINFAWARDVHFCSDLGK